MDTKKDLFNTEKELAELEQKSEELVEELKADQRKRMLRSRSDNEKELKNVLPPLPNKKYQIVYIDPPWRYEFSRSTSREIENQYPTMDIEDIKKLPIGELAENDSVIFLWATSPKLEEAIEVIKAYGFRYVTSAIWDKLKIGMGYYFRNRHELLLVGKKGALPVPKPENRVSSVIEIPRGKHSKKPVELYTILEAMYPNATKIEIFSRIDRKGWDTWGFEKGTIPAPEYGKTTLLKEKWET